MKRLLPVCFIICALSGAAEATPLLDEGFEGTLPLTGWAAVSIDQSTTYKHAGDYSAKFSANTDSLITPIITAPETLTFWTYTTTTDPGIIVEQGSGTNGPWNAVSGSPFSGNTDQWNQRTVTVTSTNQLYFRFKKSGSGTLYIDDVSVEDGAAAGNLPPVLDPIGGKDVFEGLAVSFAVTASDPIDSDPITLSVANLPTGANFSTNGVFTWSSAAPAGVYAVTFYAIDKDGAASEVVTITVSPRPQLLISEIADPAGTGGDVYRFVELYNVGDDTIDLSANNWHLSKQLNGGTWSDIPLAGSISPASAWVIAYSATDFQDAYGHAPEQESSSVSGNGNDAYFLYYGGNHTNGILIDVYGQTDTDGTDTAWDYTDSRAARNNSVLRPNDVWTASEWTVTPDATTGNMTPGLHGPRPEFQGLENQFVFLGDSLNMNVTAVNTVRADVIRLSSTALPAGATFTTATGTNSVSSTLNWNIPTAGVYTATFAAAGSAGINTASITITVTNRARIAGKFYGWSGDTIFKLENGQFWQQSVLGAKAFPTMNRPYVTITNVFGQRRLYLSNDYTRVALLPVIESTVTNTFTGLHNQNIYLLADGTVWKQISFENIPSNASPVTAWRWMKDGQQMLRFLNRDDAVIGTCIAESAAPPANTTVSSEIAGWFRGWQSKRVFALANGQFWQQTSLENSSQTLYRPAVTVSNWLQTGNWRMSVAGLSGYVAVQRLTNVVRTTVSGNFYGFGLRNIFKLSNGEWWRQTSSDISTSTRLSPEILVWSENGIDHLEMPDEGRRVAATQLNVQFESTITNSFTGLHYGNLYRLDGNGDWIQLSFENISTNVNNPSVMLWKDGSQTNMTVRDERNVTIGNCIVGDPANDADSDGLNNEAEVLAGFDPLDSQSRFELRQTDRYVLSWEAVEGRVYTIEWTPSLTQPFQPLENSIVWPQNSWTDTVHTAGTKGFYRITVRLAE